MSRTVMSVNGGCGGMSNRNPRYINKFICTARGIREWSDGRMDFSAIDMLRQGWSKSHFSVYVDLKVKFLPFA